MKFCDRRESSMSTDVGASIIIRAHIIYAEHVYASGATVYKCSLLGLSLSILGSIFFLSSGLL